MGLVAKAFQDIITFSRASSGTYVNSNGYITNSSVLNYLTYSNQPENAAWTKSNSFVQQNLLLRSEEFDNATWVKSSAGVGVVPVVTANQGVAPDGTLTADRVDFDCGSIASAANRSYITQSVAVTAGVAYTDSIWIKAFDAATVGKTIRFILEGGGASGTNIFTITSEWQRIVVSGASAVGASVNVLMETRGTYSSSATASVLLWAGQLVQGSVPGDYRATTSAALPCLYADYNGALRARQVVRTVTAASESGIQQTGSALLAGASMTLSVVAKTGNSGNYLYLRNIYVDGNLPAGVVTFDLATGTIVYTGSTYTGKASIVSAGNGFYRCSITGNVASSPVANRVDVGLTTSNSGGVGGTLGDYLYIADAQLNDGTSALAYYDTTASAYNAPRFDYDPVTLAAKGLLVEEQRANLLLQSNDFLTSWTPGNITRTLNSILSPSGNVDGVKIAATASIGTVLQQAATVAATSATGSVYAKQGTGATVGNNFLVRNATTATILIAGTINYATGVFTYTTGSTGVVVINAGNGWWRIAITATTGITSGDSVQMYVGFNGNAATAGDHLYAYGAQLEAGAFATSYISTSASQVTRAADVASVNTLSPWYNSVAGTFYAEGSRMNLSVSGSLVEFGDGTNSNRIFVYGNPSGSSGSYMVVNGGVTQASIDVTNGFLTNTVGKIAAAYAVNDFQQASNAVLGTADTSGTLPTVSAMFIGRAGSGLTAQWNGWIRRITYYPRRLTNAELQTLTTL